MQRIAPTIARPLQGDGASSACGHLLVIAGAGSESAERAPRWKAAIVPTGATVTFVVDLLVWALPQPPEIVVSVIVWSPGLVYVYGTSNVAVPPRFFCPMTHELAA